MSRIAAVQMNGTGNLTENLQRAKELATEAAERGAELIVLPENFAYYRCKDLRAAAADEQSPQGPARQFLSQLARELNVWLIGGTLPVQSTEGDDKRGYACCLVYNNAGEEVGRYDKIHLFDVDVGDAHNSYRESDDYRPGNAPVVLETPFGKLGLTVCYDIRFAELYRNLADAGAEIVIVPAAFTARTGEVHWETLLKARAIENQCFVVGANMGDRDHPKKATWGGSTIIHPWGNVLADLQGGEGVIVADVDTSEIAALKQKMPITDHRRL